MCKPCFLQIYEHQPVGAPPSGAGGGAPSPSDKEEQRVVAGHATNGHYFGDVEVFRNTLRLFSYRTATNCSLMSVQANVLLSLFRQHPKSKGMFARSMKARSNYLDLALSSATLALSTYNVLVKETVWEDGSLVPYERVSRYFRVGSTSKTFYTLVPAKRPAARRNSPSSASETETLEGPFSPRRHAPTSGEWSVEGDGDKREDQYSGGMVSVIARDAAMYSSWWGRQVVDFMLQVQASSEEHLPSGTGGSYCEEKEETASDMWQRVIIHPDVKVKVAWDVVVTLVVAYSVFEDMISVCFNVPVDSVHAFIERIVLSADILVSFRTAYYDQSLDVYVAIPSVVAMNYLSGWFFLDFLSSSNWQDLFLPLSSHVTVLQMFRVLRLVKIMTTPSSILKYIHAYLQIHPLIIIILQNLFMVLFMVHLISCLYWFVTVENVAASVATWADDRKIRDADVMTQYITTLYWTVITVTSTGYGDIVPVNTRERIAAMATMLVGVLFIGIVISNMTDLINSFSTKSKMQRALLCVRDFLQYREVSTETAYHVMHHYTTYYKNNYVEDEDAILRSLPRHVSNAILTHLHKRDMALISLLTHLPSHDVALHVFQLMTYSKYEASSFLVKSGDEACHIVFLISGSAAAVSFLEEGSSYGKVSNKDAAHSPGARSFLESKPARRFSRTVVKVYEAGDFFGHEQLMHGECHTLDIEALSTCFTYMISEEALLSLRDTSKAVAKMVQRALARAILESREKTKPVRRKTKSTRNPSASNETKSVASIDDHRVVGEGKQGETMALKTPAPHSQILETPDEDVSDDGSSLKSFNTVEEGQEELDEKTDEDFTHRKLAAKATESAAIMLLNAKSSVLR